MRLNKLIGFFIGSLMSILFISPLSAQQTIVKATIDSTAMLIGEQTLIHLEVVTNKDKDVRLPVFSDTIMNGVEVLEMLKADTTDLGNNRLQINQDYLITSFDSALYLLPPFMVIDGNDTVYSNTLGLKISTFPVDTESQQFYDIKDVITPKFVLSDYLAIILIILGVIILGLVIWYVVRRLKTNKSLVPFKKEEPRLPPHIVAIHELDDIKTQKLWQQGRSKEYHSMITDTLRKYIEERFHTAALEMTSGEILQKIRHLSDADSVYDNLKQILQLADFVKFAKYHPLPDENELSLMNAYLFVNQTKQEEQILPAKDNQEKNPETNNPDPKDTSLKQSN